MRGRVLKALFITLLTLTNSAFASESHGHGSESESESDIKAEIKAYIQHHLQDSHDFGLYSYEDDKGEHVYVSFPLPVIFYDEGVHVMSSSAFDHGKKVVESQGKYYALHHGKIYRTDKHGHVEYDEEGHITSVAPVDFSITKNVSFIIIVSLLMFFMFRRMANSYKDNGMPSGLGRFLEPIILFVRDDIAIPNIGKDKYKRYMSFLLTVFFFIWIINLFGLTPLGVNVTNNIAVTACLAIIVYLITTFSGNADYWKHIFWMPGVPVPMKILLAPIELLGTIIKPFSLMIRLYANITAGHIVLMSLIGMMFVFNNWLGSSLSFVLAFVLAILELLVAALQAYIFTMLAALYFGSAVEEHEHEHAH